MNKFITFGSSPLLSFDSSGQTFPAIVASHLNKEYDCKAKPLSSNNKIARTILSNKYDANDVLLVVWTCTKRFEFRTEHGWYGTDMKVAQWDPTANNPPGFETDWYNGPGQWEYTMILNTLKEMLIAQTFLKNQGINYLYTLDCDDLVICWLFNNPDAYLKSLIELIDWNQFFLFNGQGFVDWARTQGYEFIHGNHCGNAGHAAAAEYILTNTKITNYTI